MKYQTTFSDNYYFEQDAVNEFEGVSLPKKRSRELSIENNYCYIKNLTKKQKQWLELHDKTNWKDFELFQNYLKVNKKGKSLIDVIWKLPGTAKPGDECGKFRYFGCLNHDKHPHGKALVQKRMMSCFKSECERCWLEKWLARESNRATRRIENYVKVCKTYRLGSARPIHVIVSPAWKDKFIRFDLLKKKCRKLLHRAGVRGGLMIYHPASYNKEKQRWVVRPHFHLICFGWVVNTKKISDDEGWVIKNKGLRDSLHSTIYYQLSHAGVSDKELHSVTWFGDLGYRAKYATEIKVEDDSLESKLCPFCNGETKELHYVGVDRPPPPDIEFEALLNPKDWRYLAIENYDVFRKKFV